MLKNTTYTFAAGAALLALVLAGCSKIKEERISCPCYLTVMTDGEIHDGHAGNVSVSTFQGTELNLLCKRENVTLSDFRRGRYTTVIERARTRVCCVGGRLERAYFQGDTALLVPVGCESDSLCSSSRDVEIGAADDELTVTMPLRKQFSTMTMRTAGTVPYSFRVRGGWCGFCLPTAEPVAGDFTYDLSQDADSLYRMRLPRQGDSSLKMEVWSGRRPGQAYGRLLETLDLGDMIERTGFSWTEDNLGDINVDLDYSLSQITLYVNDWKDGRTFTFTI